MPKVQDETLAEDDVIDITSSDEPIEEPAESLGFADADDAQVRQALEALLIISDQPISSMDLATTLQAPVERIDELVNGLAKEYVKQGRGFELRCSEDGWRFYSASECSDVVATYVREGKSARLTQAALETLAVVAYKQPISRARIGAIRGVNVDGVIRTLLTRGLVTEMETDPHTGAVLYGTTAYFLERMGLDSIADLPPIVDHLPDLSVLDDFIDPSH